MKRLLVLLIALTLGAHASTWRSSQGQIYNFQPGGRMQTYVSGKNKTGTWWWVSEGQVFSYRLDGTVSTVTIKGRGAICKGPGAGPINWTQMVQRSAGDEEEEEFEDESWFMPATLP